MADRYCGSILVGGPLKRADMDDFLSAVCGDGASHDWGEPPIDINNEKALLEYVQNPTHDKTKGMFYACDDQARNGMFEEIEGVCRELGLSYDRYSDAYAEWSGEANIYRPVSGDGPDPVLEFLCSQEGNLLVEYDTVRLAIKALEENESNKAKTMLQAIAPAYPPIPKFEIVD